MTNTKYNKSLFKWAGGKGKALKHVLPILEKHKQRTLVEPFIGAANISLNFDTDKYIWNDINEDLINTYKLLVKTEDVSHYINICKVLFNSGYNDYYELRRSFNQEDLGTLTKCAIFQYLNKFGYNGLARYNLKGEFNVPIGNVKKNLPNIPTDSINLLHKRHKNNTALMCKSYEEVFEHVEELDNCLIYSDSPYVPLTTEFKYSVKGFNKEDHIKLKELSKNSKHTSIISNHWTDFTKELYKDADELYTFEVQRTISCDGGGRKKVEEVVAVYLGGKE